MAKFVSVYGERKQVITQLEAVCGTDSIGELKALSELLEGSAYSDRIIFDFSVVNNMSYYNGIVFKGFLNGICDGVLAGGQYDKLMRKLGRKAGAIGFALYLDLLEQLPAPKKEHDVDVLLLYGEETSQAAVAAAVAELVEQGLTVSAQKSVPAKLRYRELRKIGEEGTAC